MIEQSWDVDDLGALKELAVRTSLENFHRHAPGIEIVAAVSSDAAIAMLGRRIYFDARLLHSVVRAARAMHELADNFAADVAQEQKDHCIREANTAMCDLASRVDADGTAALQVTDDPDCAWSELEHLRALAILRWWARSGNSSFSEKEKQEKEVALKTVVSPWPSFAPVSDEEVAAAVEVLGRLAELS